MKKIMLLSAIAATLISCNHNEDCPLPSGEKKTIHISSLIASASPVQAAMPGTRTAYNGSIAAWADNDAIGIFCTQSTPAASNTQFTVTGTASTPVWATTTPIYWADGTTAHKFLAYAPYAAGNADATAVKLPNIGTQTGAMTPTLDFLISNNQNTTGVTRANAPVALTFTHAFALVEFQIKFSAGATANTKLSSVVLASPTTTDKLYTSDALATIALATGAITPVATSNTATVTLGTPPTLSSTATSVYILMLPGTFTTPTVTITISEGGSPITIPATGIGTTLLEAAKKYTYAVTISRTAIIISPVSITDWINVPGTPIAPGV